MERCPFCNSHKSVEYACWSCGKGGDVRTGEAHTRTNQQPYHTASGKGVPKNRNGK